MPDKYELFLDKNKKVKLSANEQGDLFAEANGKAIKLGADGLQAIADDGSLKEIGGGLEGDTFVYVSGAGTAAENGQELADAIETAKTVKRKTLVNPLYFLEGHYNQFFNITSVPLIELYPYEFAPGTTPYELGINTGDELQVTALELHSNTTVTTTWRILQSDQFYFQAEVLNFQNAFFFQPYVLTEKVLPGTIVVAPGNYDITNTTKTNILDTVFNFATSKENLPVLNLDVPDIAIVSLDGRRSVNITGSLFIEEKNISLKGLILEDDFSLVARIQDEAGIIGENLKVGKYAFSTINDYSLQDVNIEFEFSNCDFGDFCMMYFQLPMDTCMIKGELNNCNFGDAAITADSGVQVPYGGYVDLNILNCNFGYYSLNYGEDISGNIVAKNSNFNGSSCIYFTGDQTINLYIDGCTGYDYFIMAPSGTINGYVVNSKSIHDPNPTGPMTLRSFHADSFDLFLFNNCYSEMTESFGFPFAQAYSYTDILRCSTAGDFWDPTNSPITTGNNSIRFCLKHYRSITTGNYIPTEEIPAL